MNVLERSVLVGGWMPHTERRQKDLRAVECYGGVGTSRPVCAFTRHIGLARSGKLSLTSILTRRSRHLTVHPQITKLNDCGHRAGLGI